MQYNTSAMWSNLIDIPNPTSSSNPANTFNGVLATTANPGAIVLTDSSTTTSTATLPITLSNSTVKVTYYLVTSQSDFVSMVAGNQTSTTPTDFAIIYMKLKLLEQQDLLLFLRLSMLQAQDLVIIFSNMK